MKSHFATVLLWLYLAVPSVWAGPDDVLKKYVVPNDVIWSTPGTNENDSMPIGNGDLAANIWTEQNGDLVVLVAKADAWTEAGTLVKLGRVRVHLTPNPFADAPDFAQVLKLENSSVEIRRQESFIRVWVDANHPALHIEAHLADPASLQAGLEIWRTNACPLSAPSPERGGLFEFGDQSPALAFEPDLILPADSHSLTWCHFNQASVYPVVFQQEHLEAFLSKYPDPLFASLLWRNLGWAWSVKRGRPHLGISFTRQEFPARFVCINPGKRRFGAKLESRLRIL